MCDIIRRNREEAAKEAAKEQLIESLRNLIKNTKWSAKQAMDALGIPESEQPSYASAL